MTRGHSKSLNPPARQETERVGCCHPQKSPTVLRNRCWCYTGRSAVLYHPATNEAGRVDMRSRRMSRVVVVRFHRRSQYRGIVVEHTLTAFLQGTSLPHVLEPHPDVQAAPPEVVEPKKGRPVARSPWTHRLTRVWNGRAKGHRV